MSITIATGTAVAIATAYGTSVNMTAITNATEAVATMGAGHGYVVGDILEITTSGWDLMAGRMVRVKTVATNDITFEGIDTSSTSRYPAGSGAGTVRKVSTWTSVPQVQNIDSSDGDQNYADITTIADRVQKQVPTTRNPILLTLTDFDDPTRSDYASAVSAAESASNIGLRIVFPNNSRLLANCYISVQKTPNIAANTPLTAQISFSALAEPTRYAT